MDMPMSLTQSQIEKRLTNEDLDELLHLWWAEQGAEKRRDLDHDATLQVLDLCCGPGDVGRAIRARYPNSDCVDRDIPVTFPFKTPSSTSILARFGQLSTN
jgi:hypothetical protein